MLSRVLRNNSRLLRPTPPSLRLRALSTTPVRFNVQEITRPAIDTPLSLWNFTEEENMLRETVRRFAQDVIGPKVREMDEKEIMDPAIIQGLFDNGVRWLRPEFRNGGCNWHMFIVDGDWDFSWSWRLRVLLHVCHYCSRGVWYFSGH